MKQIAQHINNNSLPLGVTFKLQQRETFLNDYIKFMFMEQEKLIQELQDFKKYLVLNYALREITIRGHLENIKRMLNVLENLNPEKEEVTDYVYELRNSNKSSSHQLNNIYSIEKYMDFKKKLVRYSKPKKQRRIVEVLSEAEIGRMIQSTKNIKEKAMISILAYSGVRNRSFCNIKLKDVDFGNNLIKVRKAKGRKEYMPHISSECIKIILDYLKEYPRKDDEFLFTTKVNNNQYQTSDIRKLIRVLAQRAEIGKNVYPHILRHSLASNMWNRGGNIMTIKNQLGHDWIQSTEIYLTCLPQRIKSEYEIYKPSYI